MTSSPRVVIGVTLYNRADFLAEALESLLAQTYRDFAIVLLDDGSTDMTPDIVQRYASIDSRLVYRRNETRLGMVGNWRRAFELSLELFPQAEFFAWGSDHDVWHPHWLAALSSEMECSPSAVLAYPLNIRISDTGERIRGPWTFETRGVKQPGLRMLRACWGMSAGNMIYGLFRASALRRAGLFRPVLAPDRLMLTEMALYGEFRQVPEILWYRRFAGLFSLSRQRTTLFAGQAPWYSYLPWWVMHAGPLTRALVFGGNAGQQIGRARGLLYMVGYLLVTLAMVVRRSPPVRSARSAVRRGRFLVKSARSAVRRVLRSKRLRRQLATVLARADRSGAAPRSRRKPLRLNDKYTRRPRSSRSHRGTVKGKRDGDAREAR